VYPGPNPLEGGQREGGLTTKDWMGHSIAECVRLASGWIA